MKNLKRIGYGGILSGLFLAIIVLGGQSVFATVQMTPDVGGGGDTSLNPTAFLTASPRTINSGESATLTWTSGDVTMCTGSGFSTGGALSGSVTVGPLTANQTYSLNCTGSGGAAGGTVTVTVGTTPQTATPGTSGAQSTNTATTPNPGATLAPLDQTVVNGTSTFTKTNFGNGIVSCGRETVADTSKLSQPQLNTLSRQIATSCGFQEFMFFLQRLVNYALIIATLLMVFSIGYTGFEFFQAGDKPGELKKLKGRLLDIVIGSVILLASWLIFNTVASYLPTALQSYIYLTNVKQ